MHPGGVRREVAAALALGVLVLSGCSDEPSGDEVAVRVDGLDHVPVPESTSYLSMRDGLQNFGEPSTPTDLPEPTSYPTPTYEAPELDDTQYEADLAALSPGDRALVDHYLHARGDDGLGEGTWIVASPMTIDEARLRLLGPQARPATRADEHAMMDGTAAAYSFLQVGDGVVIWEYTGFADPPRRLLAELSRDGAVSAVATNNIEAMTRFGYARDGQVVFDAFEYAFVDRIGEIPAEVRDLARLAWEDTSGPMVKTASWFRVAMAMSEKVTGVRASRDVRRVRESYVVPIPWGVAEDG